MNNQHFINVMYHALLGREVTPTKKEAEWHVDRLKISKNPAISFFDFNRSQERLRKISENPQFLLEPKEALIEYIKENNLGNEIEKISDANVKNYLSGEVFLSQWKLREALDCFSKVNKSFSSDSVLRKNLIELLLCEKGVERERLMAFSFLGEQLSQEGVELIKGGGKVALIDYHHDGYLASVFSIALYLKERGHASILVKPGKPRLIEESDKIDLNILAAMEYESIEPLKKIHADKIYYHCEGAEERAESYIGKIINKDIEIISYSDSLRNSHKQKSELVSQSIDRVHTFCVEHTELSSNLDSSQLEISPIANYTYAINNLVKKREREIFSGLDKSSLTDTVNVSLFCSRYWGHRGYLFDPEDVANSWYETIRCEHDFNDVLVIKKHPHDNEEVISRFLLKLNEGNVSYIFLGDYFCNIGMPREVESLPVEDIISMGLIKVRTFFTLDSSLPSLICLVKKGEDSIKKIVIGSKGVDNKFRGLPGSGTFDENFRQQNYSVRKILLSRGVAGSLILKSSCLATLNFES
ncbi:hypothetical protein [Vreelandella aquamarina]|uniref:hypothetical protein n=1 Tax=Vreelandella aquamarina TaxID=77097 RepID=UPI003CFF1514